MNNSYLKNDTNGFNEYNLKPGNDTIAYMAKPTTANQVIIEDSRNREISDLFKTIRTVTPEVVIRKETSSEIKISDIKTFPKEAFF